MGYVRNLCDFNDDEAERHPDDRQERDCGNTSTEMAEIRDLVFDYARNYLAHSHVHEDLDEFAERVSLDIRHKYVKEMAKAAVRELESQGVKRI